MENNIRIGKDFNVQWAIYKVVDGERLPYDLVGKELQLYIVNDNGRKEVAGWKVQGNVIEWTYLGKDQKRLGAYQLILVENAGKEGMVTVDTCKAFNLVEHSCEENVDGGNDIVIKTVTLESEVALAPVVKEIGGGASEEDIQEIKNDIAELKEKNAEQATQLTELSAENERLKERIEEQDQFIEDLQNTKIDRENDDYYPKMAVGTSDNLAGVEVVDSEINFRRSGGGAITDGVARIEAIKGNSVVWNQLRQDDSFVSQTKQGVTLSIEGNAVVLNGTSEGNVVFAVQTAKRATIVANHKYLIFGGVQGVANYNFYDNALIAATGQSNTIFTALASSKADAQRIYCATGQTFTNYKIYPCLYDLTQMFGSGNEPTTIEEFYARIPMGVDLNAYNEGEVIHMDVQSIESQGVNAWDEEWESGGYDTTTGNKTSGANFIRTKNLIQVFGGQSYYITLNGKTCYAWLYDSEQKFIKYTSVSSSNVLSIPSNCAYIGLRLGSGSAPITTYNHDICINISDTAINGKYFPYIKRVEDLAVIRKYFPNGMRSAGTAHDEIRYNKATQKWEKVVRIGEADMGKQNYTYQKPIEGTYPHGYFLTQIAGKAIGNSNMLCGKYNTIVDWVSIGVRGSESSINVYIKDSAYTDVASVKAAMSGVILYYELAEPIVTELDETDQFKDLDYQVWNCGTEKAIAEGKSAPLAADITYGFNAIGKIKEQDADIAAIKAALAKAGITLDL